MEGMLDTLAYCLGFGGNGITPIDEIAPTFKTQETEDQWTLVDLNGSESEGKTEVNDFPRPLTPPPSPKLEHSWFITPPPCFNAEKNVPVGELSARENLLIEHPSMFVCPPLPNEEATPPVNEEPPAPVVQPHRGAPTSLRRSQRRASRQASSAISQQNRRHNSNSQFKRTNCDVFRRNNKSVQKMRQLVQQPRKHC